MFHVKRSHVAFNKLRYKRAIIGGMKYRRQAHAQYIKHAAKRA